MTVTCKTNVLSLLGIFLIILSIHPSICYLSITNFNDDILTLVEIKRSSIAPWPYNFSNSSKISEVAAFFQKKNVCLKSVPDDCTTPIFSDLLVSSPNFAPPWRILLNFINLSVNLRFHWFFSLRLFL